MRNRTTAEDPRWARVVARDRTADGLFWYSVATTGVYCRPSCASRTANPKNVTLHETLAEARATGCRACKRCKPEDSAAPWITTACRLLEGESPSLAELARAVGLSSSHLHRQFKAATGLTPKAYAAAQQAKRVRDGLAEGRSVTAAMYDAGFNSSGRFYERAHAMLGMTPSRYRAGGAQEVLRFAVGQCALGAILVASSAKGVTAILLGEDPDVLVRDLQDRFPRAELIGADAEYEHLVARVVGLMERPKLAAELPLDVRGTVFQQRVWRALQAIPVGHTVSYAEVAQQIGAPKAMRAVASACAANHLAVAIPCHRVVRHDGALSGYAWGVERKQALLERERAVVHDQLATRHGSPLAAKRECST